jgi:hypothetical protein
MLIAVLRFLIFCALHKVQAVKLGRADNSFDLVAQTCDIGLNFVAIHVLFLRGHDFTFDIRQKPRHRFGRITGNGHSRFTQSERILNSLKPFYIGFHHLRNRPNSRVIFGGRNRFARRNL